MSRILSPLLLALLACKEDPEKEPGEAADGPAPNWFGEVQPVVNRACGSCHDVGGIGGWVWTDTDAAVANATLLASAVQAERMPPASADPECRPYQGWEHMTLTDDERALIVAWAEGGAELGDEALAEEYTPNSLGLPEVHHTMSMPRPHELDPADGSNQYWCQVAENPFTTETAITGIDVALGDAAVVHHMCLFLDERGNAGTTYGVDAATAASTGFSCENPVIENDWTPLHCWAPGMEPVVFPEGAGLPISPDAQLVIQMHYYIPDGEIHEDLSAYEFMTDPLLDGQVQMVIFGPEGFRIPAGEAEHSVSETMTNDWGPLTVYGAFPHMHLLGQSYEASVQRSDGSEDCMVSGRYDFGHQMTYMLEETMTIEEGDELSFSCTFDNSEDNPNNPNSPPQDVTFGEATTQEMCYLLFYLSAG
jgi:Copper type II ascorbate-dependent monooxygenase, N-terminal domain/Copper type II ascorbate-dependent monooxygenase, C-terminal domain